MTQSRTGQLATIQIVPVPLPTASLRSRSAPPDQSSSTLDALAAADLCLYPGEPGQLLVQIYNHAANSLTVSIQVEAEFPQEWYQIGLEGTEVLSSQIMDAVVQLAVPPTFFEEPLVRSQLPLKLNHTGRLVIQVQDVATRQQETLVRPFQFEIRSHSLYLDFLPGIYRNVDFIGRLLKVFETTFEPSVNSLNSLWAYLDPLTAPQGLLPFLAHWVGWSTQIPLPLEQQRFLIRNALQIYRWRGTRRGLRFFLHLATGLPLDEHISAETAKHIGIHENFSAGFVVGAAHLGEETVLGGSHPFHFTVCLRPDPGHPPLDEALIRTIINQEKPAFCAYQLIIERADTPDLAALTVSDPPSNPSTNATEPR